ncbi:hypothetical protein [uncultured Jatrophihabitans sp.]|uniref:hypothetical protein n=1 Tax=uncultured Jatrophihabitans sp. TaxID=1610747 RepID=UPI0035CBC993
MTPYSDPATYTSVRLDASEQVTHTGSVEAHHRADGWAALVVAALQDQAGLEPGAAAEVAIEMAQRLRQETSQPIAAVSGDDEATVVSGEHAEEHELELALSDDDLAELETVARRHAVTPEQYARQAIRDYLGLGTR